MTQERRKDEQRPDRPLDWDDTEPLAGQSRNAPATPSPAKVDLSGLTRYDHRGCLMVPDETGDYYLVADVERLLERDTAPDLTSSRPSLEG